MEITLESWQTAVDSEAKSFLVGAREASALFRDGGRIIAITYAPGGRFGSWQPWVAMGAAKSAMECYVVTSPSRWQGERLRSMPLAPAGLKTVC